MPVSSSPTRSVSKSYRRQALIWLMMTLLLGVVTALIWMFSQTPAIGAKIENKPISAPEELSTELKQPLSIDALHELDTDVQPINFEDTIRDLRNYPDEFKDKSFLVANKGKWTVQVMNVAEHEVIVSYLDGRNDRDKFSYFRYRDGNDQIRYMLTYGLMSSPQEAAGAAKLIDFGLPANVRVLPEEINRYVGIIDNYERPKPIKDLSTRRSRTVRLQPTQDEVAMREKAEADKNAAANNANQTSNNKSQSIRESEDTSATLAVNEERTVVMDGEVVQPTKPKTEETTDKTAQDNKNLPVVPTPPAPKSQNTAPDNTAPNNVDKNSNGSNNTSNTSNGSNTASAATNNTSNKSTNTDNTKKSTDSIKALIEEKTD